MSKNRNIPELLAPAGSEDSLFAALAAGADAVYFGGQGFSNRMRAKNFTDESIKKAISLAHDAGALAYITVNTRVRDREIDDVLRLCETILGGEEKCDAVICADLGLGKIIRERYPHAVLHASTQTSLTSSADCDALLDLGFSRLVVPRELSRDEIAALSSKTEIDLEMFIHGAHCVSLSGQCLMSYFIGNRSGNRGECAQPCRLPYRLGNNSQSYPLSLRDMCLGGNILAVMESGVKSLKIEGRLKAPTYVYGVTKIYRTLLDDGRNASPDEIKALSDLFTRGFTDGYFTHRYFSMTGERSTEKNTRISNEIISKELKARIANEALAKKARALENKLPIRGKFILSAEKSELTLSALSRNENVTVTAFGALPSSAEGKALDSTSAAKNLTKFGSTPFVLSQDDLDCVIGENLWMPASALNELRRQAALLLEDELSKITETKSPAEISENSRISENSYRSDFSDKPNRTAKNLAGVNSADKKAAHRKKSAAEFLDARVLTKLSRDQKNTISDHFDVIYVPHESATEIKDIFRDSNTEIAAVLPALEPSSDRVERIIKNLAKSGIGLFMTHTVGQAAQAINNGCRADISFRGNITNTAAAEVYRDLGCESIFASPELPAAAVSAMGLSAIVYGKIPAMTLSRCIIAQSGKNKKCPMGNEGGRAKDPDRVSPHSCRCTITDRTGTVFSVFGQQNCENIIVNAHPVWMGDRMDSLKGADTLVMYFTDENAEEIIEIIKSYKNGEKGDGRRM